MTNLTKNEQIIEQTNYMYKLHVICMLYIYINARFIYIYTFKKFIHIFLTYLHPSKMSNPKVVILNLILKANGTILFLYI